MIVLRSASATTFPSAPLPPSSIACTVILAASLALASCGSGLFALESAVNSDNNGPSAINELTVTSTRQSPALLDFLVSDPDRDRVDLEIEFALDGISYQRATLLDGVESLQDPGAATADTDLDNLASSLDGVRYRKLWDFTADGLAAEELTGVRVSVRAAGRARRTLDVLVGDTDPEVTLTAASVSSLGDGVSGIANLGAQGPEPAMSWVDVLEPASKGRFAGRFATDSAPASMEALGYVEGERVEESAEAYSWAHAAVESEGLSLRYRIARSETVESRNEPTVVLVGQADLEAEAEYYCAPTLDTTVWLRGIATNTSPWTLLPGRAAVFFGADYLGDAMLDMVQVEEEFTLHLGAAPMISVERTQFEDVEEEPGFLSSTVSKRRSWRVHFENHGSTVANSDGSVTVLVRESVPVSQDSRLEVLMPKSEPKYSEDERWTQEREEEGIYTWELQVPANGDADLVYSVEIRHPNELQVTGW